MKISYDPEVDALYIRLIEGKYECRTLRLNEETALNIGPDEKLIGIEILDAKEVLGSGQLPKIVVENLPLAKVCGGEKQTEKTTFTVDLGFGVVVVREVPATVCSQCGEDWIDDAIAEKLEKIVEDARQKHNLVEITTLAR